MTDKERQTAQAPEGPLQIDLQRIVRERVPASRRKWIPKRLVCWLEKLVCQNELNGILQRTYPKTGTAFASAALEDLNITIEVRGMENIPEQGRFIFASNHPLGGLDGIALISVLGRKYGDEYLRFPVNDMLMNVRPLRGIFIPINKFGRQGREAARKLAETYASEAQIIFFPAGLVSRLHKGGVIKDLQWQKAFVAKAMEYDRDIIPIHFSGHNTMKFYRTAKWRKRLGLKFNIEQILLPQELCKAKGSRYVITIGKPIKVSELKASGKNAPQLAADIRNLIYALEK
ncbi:MAG: 1-acyl-sn-glycerol-3-phosphate acyltransferase [Muribaculaceae bacterium]|nr:1-acyl-sn-glycerol-3-phosphate acyltransferase [Muribaculaceae bacterium]